jgi:uncharacterized protein (TIGR02452 family)
MEEYKDTYWNHKAWLIEFKICSHEREGFRELRQAVYHNTLEIVRQGFYWANGKKIIIENQKNPHLCEDTIMYQAPKKVENFPANVTQTISVINADCLETAQMLKLAGYNPAVLNMANGIIPGGAVKTGAGAQEENIFRRSNLFVSLYQYIASGEKYEIPPHPKHTYPLQPKTGGVYSPHVTVFRGNESNGYCLLTSPYKIAVISVPAIHNPPLVIIERRFYLANDQAEITKEKMRTILRIAIIKMHDSLVLSAFGCGAFANPPEHIAKLFGEIFEEEEFKNKIKILIFAIIDDHNAWRKHNPEGNVLPFMQEFM